MKAKAILVSGCALVAMLGACSSLPPPQKSAGSADPTVAVKMFVFAPSTLSVKVGETVTWTNSDQILHTATSGRPGSPSGVFDGTMEGQGRSFTHTFRTAGSYRYFCDRHNGMRGEVVVSA